GSSDGCHRRPAGTRRPRLARRCARQADVTAGCLRCRGVACGSTATVSRPALFQRIAIGGRNSVSSVDLSRRTTLLALGALFNAAVGLLLAVPIVGYILSPVIRGRKTGYESWLSLGPISQFPAGQTRLATYRNPVASPTDGETANIPC